MLSFHNDVAIKEKYVARLAQHHALDQIIQGTGYDEETSRGCAVGCTLDKYDHSAYETELGLPAWLAHLEDVIFEGLPASEAPAFAKDFLECIPVGVDVSDVHWKLSILRLTKLLEGLHDNKESYARECETAITGVIKFCRDRLNKVFGTETEVESANGSVEDEAWDAASVAEAAARDSAAWSDVRSAAWSAANAAKSAAWSAANAAKSAAWSAEESVAWCAAWSAVYAVRFDARAASGSAAESAARSAERSAGSAARAAWWAAWSAEDAAWSDVRSAAGEAACAARSAAWSAAEAAEAMSAHYRWEAETLIKLLKECK